MKIFNTLSRQKEEFVPLEPGKVKMYVCGPTVYNYIHIGNARPMIVFDTVRRYFEYKGYEVNYVSNFTDIDDKIINRALEEGVDASVISERFIAECKKDMAGLNVKPATTHPQATKEIEGMLSMIHTLIETGHAYVAADGTVYFRTASFPDYGKLSHKNLDELQSGFREIKVTGEEGKEAPADFVLWKPKKEGEPYWESPWCQGRPGWHIECSVMAKRYLGDEIDIHAGGEDLIFPHHENEIAQSECANGKPFAKYWMHNGFLNIDNKKMSKSLGNFFTVREISERYDLQVLRFFMLSAHYRSPLNFSEELMEASKNGLERIRTAVGRLSELEQKTKESERSGAQGIAEANGGTAADSVQKVAEAAGKTVEANVQKVAETAGKTMEASAKTAAETAGKAVDDGTQAVCSRASAGQENTAAAAEQENAAAAQELVAKYEAAMDDDFNTADAISAVFELVKLANSTAGEGSSTAYISYLKGTIEKLCDVMGIITEAKHEALDAEIEAMIEERQAARKAKNYAMADEIREKLSEMGIILEDTRQGVKWRRA